MQTEGIETGARFSVRQTNSGLSTNWQGGKREKREEEKGIDEEKGGGGEGSTRRRKLKFSLQAGVGKKRREEEEREEDRAETEGEAVRYRHDGVSGWRLRVTGVFSIYGGYEGYGVTVSNPCKERALQGRGLKPRLVHRFSSCSVTVFSNQ